MYPPVVGDGEHRRVVARRLLPDEDLGRGCGDGSVRDGPPPGADPDVVEPRVEEGPPLSREDESPPVRPGHQVATPLGVGEEPAEGRLVVGVDGADYGPGLLGEDLPGDRGHVAQSLGLDGGNVPAVEGGRGDGLPRGYDTLGRSPEARHGAARSGHELRPSFRGRQVANVGNHALENLGEYGGGELPDPVSQEVVRPSYGTPYRALLEGEGQDVVGRGGDRVTTHERADPQAVGRGLPRGHLDEAPGEGLREATRVGGGQEPAGGLGGVPARVSQGRVPLLVGVRVGGAVIPVVARPVGGEGRFPLPQEVEKVGRVVDYPLEGRGEVRVDGRVPGPKLADEGEENGRAAGGPSGGPPLHPEINHDLIGVGVGVIPDRLVGAADRRVGDVPGQPPSVLPDGFKEGTPAPRPTRQYVLTGAHSDPGLPKLTVESLPLPGVGRPGDPILEPGDLAAVHPPDSAAPDGHGSSVPLQVVVGDPDSPEVVREESPGAAEKDVVLPGELPLRLRGKTQDSQRVGEHDEVGDEGGAVLEPS